MTLSSMVFAIHLQEDTMKGQVREQIVDNGGKIIAENNHRIQAEFSYRAMEKAVRVFFQVTKQLKQDAVLQGGCKLTVNYRNSEVTSDTSINESDLHRIPAISGDKILNLSSVRTPHMPESRPGVFTLSLVTAFIATHPFY